MIHGTSDEVIPVDYAFCTKSVLDAPGRPRDKEIIFQADHTYSAGPQRELQRTRDWLNEQENIQQEWRLDDLRELFGIMGDLTVQ